MSHTGRAHDDVYHLLQQHLDRQAVGFPASPAGADITFLAALFSPDEARVALNLSYRPMPQDQVVAAALGDFSSEQTVAFLESAFQKGAIGWKLKDGVPYWHVMPVVIGMYEAQDGEPTREFLAAAGAYMQTRAYGRSLASTTPSQMRTIPIGKSITAEHHVATYDEIRALVRSSDGPFVIMKCICREEERIEGKPCTQTSRLETCLAMGDMAAMVLRRKHGREISADEALDILQQNEDDGLVLQPANAQRAEFVCSCCGCCCGMLGLQKRLPKPVDFWTTNFYAAVTRDLCNGCGACIKRCQVNAITLLEPDHVAKINLDRCIGCGLCVPTCPKKAMTLVRKDPGTVPPKDEEELYDTIRANRS
ncbi:MAG: 4Fe-4S binding protein [Candidatus Edwardsbacteria bacterium]|jgi:ferredoxin|nr:4Fe-4S binding protein [Candidatus Edwardsbacteria bacterium]